MTSDVNTDEKTQAGIKAQFALSALNKREKLLSTVKGRSHRSYGPSFWMMLFSGALMIGFSIMQMDHIPNGMITLVVGVILLSNATEIRTNARIDALVQLSTEEKDESL